MTAERKIGRTSISKNYATGEFIVMVWDTNGKRWASADYYGTTRQDAEETATAMKSEKPVDETENAN